MYMSANTSLEQNITRIPEKNYSIVSDDTDIWEGYLPFYEGVSFPTHDIRNRAEISYTNKLIYENNVEEIYNNMISIFPEIDPMYGWQIREIVTQLPYFKNATNAWVGLVAGDAPLVDTNEELDVELSEVIENSNFAETIIDEVRRRFVDTVSAYRIELDLSGKPHITSIDTKNLIIFVNKDMPSSIEVVVVFSIYEGADGGEYVDFVEYHYNGYIKKSTFAYGDGKIGDLLEEEEDLAFDGKYKASPIVIFKHNATGNNVYGTDQFRYWIPSMLGGMRELQNVFRLGERTREMIRKVPDSAIKKDPVDGSSVFYNKGTIGYQEGGDGSPDMEYVVPEIRMDEAVKALESAVKQISMDTQLGIIFYDISVLGSRLSSDSVRASMYPAKLEAKRIITEMKPAVKEMIVKLGYLLNIELNPSKLSIEFYDGFPKDALDDVESVQMRLESATPSITLEDAIAKLDRIPVRLAKQKAAEIRQQAQGINPNVYNTAYTDIRDDGGRIDVDEGDITDTSEVRPSAQKGKGDGQVRQIDNTVWDNQLAFPPRDIPQGNYERTLKSWHMRKSRKKVL